MVDLVGCRREKESRDKTNNTRNENEPKITMASMPPLRVRKATATMGYIPDGKSVDNKENGRTFKLTYIADIPSPHQEPSSKHHGKRIQRLANCAREGKDAAAH